MSSLLSAPLRPVENDYGEEEYPVVGDWVLTQPIPGTGSDSQPAEHKPLAILPRRSYLTRPSATRESADQPVAANVDMLCIVEPCFPEPSIGRIERYTALAHASGVQVALILTKGDLVTVEQLTNYRDSLAGGVDAVLAVCTDNGYDPAPVAELVAGRTAAFLVVAAPENPPWSTPCSTPELTPARIARNIRCRSLPLSEMLTARAPHHHQPPDACFTRCGRLKRRRLNQRKNIIWHGADRHSGRTSPSRNER